MIRKLALLTVLLGAAFAAEAQVGTGGVSSGCVIGSNTIFGCFKVDGTTVSATNGVLSASGSGGSVTSVALGDGSTTPIFSISGSPVTTTGTLTFTLSTESANTVFAGPTSGGVAQPGFRSLVVADIPSGLNQNTTGTAAGLSATLALGSGGTGQTTAAAAFNALWPATTTGDMIYSSSGTTAARLAAVAVGSYLRSAGTSTAPVWSTVTIPNAATTGDIWYASAASTISALAGSTSATKQFLTQTGNGSVSAAPVWGTIAAGDVPTLNQNTTGTSSNVSGTPALPNGTTATSQSANDNSTKLATTAYVGTAFATPPTAGYGSGTPEPVAATTVSATGVSTLAGVTNAAAQTAGNIGEIVWMVCPTSSGTASQTVTSISVASPAVVTWATTLPTSASGITNWTCPVYLNSGTTIPTGLSAATQYWVIGSSVSGNTFQIASSDTNALAGTAINTSGSASNTVVMSIGTQAAVTNTAYAGGEIKLVAGDWLCNGVGSIYNSATSASTVTWTSGISQNLATRPTTGLPWMGYSTGSVASASLGASVEMPAITGILENISATTTLYLVDYVTTGAPTDFYMGGGLSCARYH